MLVVKSRVKSITFWLAILGAFKLASDAIFNVELITGDQVNAIANGFSALFTVVGVYINNGVKKE
jgi:uncharacterized membrane protein